MAALQLSSLRTGGETTDFTCLENLPELCCWFYKRLPLTPEQRLLSAAASDSTFELMLTFLTVFS